MALSSRTQVDRWVFLNATLTTEVASQALKIPDLKPPGRLYAWSVLRCLGCTPHQHAQLRTTLYKRARSVFKGDTQVRCALCR